MPVFFVSEPFLGLWISDQPLPPYKPGLGPAVSFRLSYHDRSVPSAVPTTMYWHGAELGNGAGVNGLWSCSWLSFAELSADENTVDLMLPAGNWSTFNFPSGSSVSRINFWQNSWLEKQGPGGAVTNLILHYPSGAQTAYSVSDTNTAAAEGIGGLFYMSSDSDPAGNQTTFAYDPNFYLTNVSAADGTTFVVTQADPSYPDYITSVTASYGASASFYYLHGRYGTELTNIVDAAGISSQFVYDGDQLGYGTGGAVNQLVTPYGTTLLSTYGDSGAHGIFDRTVQITNALGQQEFYGQINSYAGSDWPDYAASQIPTNTPIGTLDTDSGGRQERNTFYWNAQQFAPFTATGLGSFNWAAFKTARIRHWLADTDPTYNHWDALSAEQAPSPDGGTAEGQITWYDYAGKPSGVDYEVGTQLLPSVAARVMPDGSTWYTYTQRLTNGLATQAVESWVESGSAHTRTNSYVYAANYVDLLAWSNALGVLQSSNVFNAYHQVATNYDAIGQAAVYTYDSATHQLTSASYPSGLTTTETYDSNHRLQQVVDTPINRTNRFTWNSDGTLRTHTDERGLTVTNYWDGLDRLTSTVYPDGTSTTNLFYLLSAAPYPNSSGGTVILDRTAAKDRMGFWTYFNYDALRRRVSETNANGVVTAYGYCSCGGVSDITNAWNTTIQAVTTMSYDNQGHATLVVYPDGYTVNSTFDSLGRATAASDPTVTRSFLYNNLGLLTSVTNGCGIEQATTFDVLNRPVYTTDANGVTVTNSYDNLGRLISRGYPDGGVERFGYSARGLTAYTNQLGYTNFYAYETAGRMMFQTNANNELLRFTNNAAGDLLSLTDGKGQTTRWAYDQYGRVTNKLDQAGTVVLKYAYDPNSLLTNRWSAAMGNTAYKYDPVGNLTNIAYPSSGTVASTYDALNRLTQKVDGVGTTAYSYNAAGQILTEDGPFASDTVTNTYVNRQRVALGLQQPSGDWTNGFAYDAAGRLTNVISQAGSFTNFYTTGVGGAPGYTSRLIQKLYLGNRSTVTNNFDSVGRELGTFLRTSGGSLVNKHEYLYDLAGERTSQTRIDASTVGYSYDRIGQLTIAADSVTSQSRGYFYDAAWNLNRRTNSLDVDTFSPNTLNELTTADFPSAYGEQDYTYDANGNLTELNIDFSAFIDTYFYDDENRLIYLAYTESGTPLDWRNPPQQANDRLSEFHYDGFGRMRERIECTNDDTYGTPTWVIASDTRYIYDGWRVIQERDGANNPATSYTRGIDLSGTLEGAGGIGGLLARSTGNGTTWTSHSYYHADGNGNIACMLDSSQSLAAQYVYDPYGNTISSSGTLADANIYRFTSKEIHLNSGLYYYGFRFYDPSTQRWLNRDPFTEPGLEAARNAVPVQLHRFLKPHEYLEGANLYEFVGNSPENRYDALGLAMAPPVPPRGAPKCLKPGPCSKSACMESCTTIVAVPCGVASVFIPPSAGPCAIIFAACYYSCYGCTAP